MTNEKLELIKEAGELATRFAELYKKYIGILDIGEWHGNPTVYLNSDAFMELFGNDYELGWFDDDGNEEYRRHIEDGVIYYALFDDDEYNEDWVSKHLCKRCGGYCEELEDGYCDICYGDMFGEEQK